MSENRPLGAALLALLLAIGCGGGGDPLRPGSEPAIPQTPPPALLALGDSYTVGEAVRPDVRWPAQLADSLAADGDTLETLEILAVTGWTSADLLAAVDSTAAAGGFAARPYGLVTLLVGANDLFRGEAPAAYALRLDTLLVRAAGLAGGDPGRVMVLSIPDYGVTPVGRNFGPEAIRAGVDDLNARLTAAAARAGVAVVDVTELSREAADDPSLLARDGLHYSGEMYGRWVAAMLPAARGILFHYSTGPTNMTTR